MRRSGLATFYPRDAGEHPTRPGTAPDPHRSLPVDNIVIYREAPVSLRRGPGMATGRAWAVLLAAADASSEGPKRPSARVLHGFGAMAKPGAKRQTQAGVAGWPDFDPDFAEEPGLIEPYLSAIRVRTRFGHGENLIAGFASNSGVMNPGYPCQKPQ